MNKRIKLLLVSLFAAGTLASCNNKEITKVFENFAVTSVTLDETYKVLEVGDSFQLTATVTYKEGKEDASVEVEWRSSNPRVAEVNEDGLVVALTPGSATISYIAGYKMATCAVYVPGSDDSGGSTPTPTPTPGPDPTPTPGPDPTPDPTPTPGPDDEEIDDEDMQCTVYFFIDYNNIDEKDETKTKLLAKFKWYGDRPISESGKVPANPTQSMDPAFPYFIGWSNHTIIDTKDDLWNVETDTIGNGYYFYLYGIWSDVSAGEFVK